MNEFETNVILFQYVEADNLEKDLLKGKDRNNRMVYHNAWRELCNSEYVI